MRDLKNVNAQGVARPRGFGFIEFERHDDALEALRATNNNPEIFGADKVSNMCVPHVGLFFIVSTSLFPLSLSVFVFVYLFVCMSHRMCVCALLSLTFLVSTSSG